MSFTYAYPRPALAVDQWFTRDEAALYSCEKRRCEICCVSET